VRLAARLLATSSLALVLAACGGGGGGGVGGGGPTTPPPGITFTPASGTAPAVRLLPGPGTAGTVLEVQIEADQLSGVYGVAFDLSFPAGLLRFDGSSEGTYLSSGGLQTSLQVVQASPGQLVVGYSRLGNVAGRGGSGELLTLRFTGIGAGTGNLSFSSAHLFNAAGDELSAPAWLGADLQVTL